MSRTIYLISGLGADDRAFNKIDFLGFEVIPLPWLIPELNESIEQYAKRMSAQIIEDSPIVIGYSFGGMMAIEIAKQRKLGKIILLSSVKTRKEIPFYYRWFGKAGLIKLLPDWFILRPNRLMYIMFGAQSIYEKELFNDFIKKVDPIYLRWSLKQIANWQNSWIPTQLIHIHGTADLLFPIRFVKCDFRIQGGNHFMAMNRSDEVSKLIRSQL